MRRWYFGFEYQPGPVVKALVLGFFTVAWWADGYRGKGDRRLMFSWNRD